MADRVYPNWIKAYLEWASFTESPRRMHFWSAVSAVAGALRRRVWIDQGAFQWLANHFIIFVAPPGVVSKSTTISLASGILKKVPGIRFGPNAVTAAALVRSFAESHEDTEIKGTLYPQCALTITSSELGNLLDPQDRAMIDLLTDLWDGQQVDFTKVTKTSGSDTIINPWINMIACTTPAWLSANFPEYVIGGGFTSRCIFVYADKKEKLVAYPALTAPRDLELTRTLLAQDLEKISLLGGPMELTDDAYRFGVAWYEHLHESNKFSMSDDRLEHWLAREQAHLHKLAMIISVSHSSSLAITEDDLAVAAKMLLDIEKDIPTIFERIGRSAEANHAERFLKYVQARGVVKQEDAVNYIAAYFPKLRDFDSMLGMLLKTGQLRMEIQGGVVVLVAR